MKAKVIFLAIAILALYRPADASWRVDTTELHRAKNISGRVPTLGPCIYATQSDCLNYIQELCRQWGVPEAAGLIKCVECDGSGVNSGGSLGQQLAQSVGDLISGGNSGGSPEQQIAGSLVTAIVGSLFSKKQNTSRQAEIDKQNAIKLKQVEELEKQHQLQLQQEQELARQRKFAEEKDRLLGAFKDTSSPTSELKFKTGTDFFQRDAVDKGDNQGVVQLLTTPDKQKKLDEWYKEQGFNSFIQIPENGINESTPPERSWGEATLRTALGQIPGLEGSIASFEMNVADASLKNLKQAVNYLVRGDDAGIERFVKGSWGGKVVKEATSATLADTVTSSIADKFLAVGQKIVKLSFEKKEVARVVEQGKMGIAPLKKILEEAKNGIEISDILYKGSKLVSDFYDNLKGK